MSPKRRRLAPLNGARCKGSWRTNRRSRPAADRGKRLLGSRCTFSRGITCIALMARAYNQAQKFGAEMAIPDEVSALHAQTDGAGNFTLQLSNGERVSTRAVVIASGARYRRPAVDSLHAFEGSSVHYWATPLEGKLCANQEVALVGGGNSAGQA